LGQSCDTTVIAARTPTDLLVGPAWETPIPAGTVLYYVSQRRLEPDEAVNALRAPGHRAAGRTLRPAALESVAAYLFQTWNLGAWPGRQAGVRGKVQPPVPLRRRGERDGHRVVAGRVEGVGRRADDRGEVAAVRRTQYRQRLVARAPRRRQLQDDAARALRRAQVDLDPLRERVVGALPVGVLVRVRGVGRRVHIGVAGL